MSMIFHDAAAGHDVDYNKSFGRAVEEIGFVHAAVVPKSWQTFSDLPSRWFPCLEPGRHSSSRFSPARFLKMISLSSSMAGCIKKHVFPMSDRIVLFIESFWSFHLVALYLALWRMSRKHVEIFLLFRWNVTRKPQRLLYKIMIWLIEKKVGTASLRLLTDSVLLQNALSTFLGKAVSVLPIPHTEFPVRDHGDGRKRDDRLRIWWPGMPHAVKGLNVVRTILKETGAFARQFVIVAARSSNLVSVDGGARSELIPDYLSRRDYEMRMMESDIVLLPYDKEAYRESTSGIFVEAIVAGKVPLVTSGTWMAKELERFQLEELVFDWSSEGILETVSKLSENQNMIVKLKRMRESYIAYHNGGNYTRSLNALFEDSQSDKSSRALKTT
ncbi:MAG: hypothetical protein AB1402_04090 [Bacillota bacterium]